MDSYIPTAIGLSDGSVVDADVAVRGFLELRNKY